MPTPTKPKPKPKPTKSPGKKPAPSVPAFLRALKHPLKPVLLDLRALILAVAPSIREPIKWNSVSFVAADHFATTNTHDKGSIRLILHNGSTPKPTAKTGIKVDDPAGLLKWLAKDRALVAFSSRADLESKRTQLHAILRQWIAHV